MTPVSRYSLITGHVTLTITWKRESPDTSRVKAPEKSRASDD